MAKPGAATLFGSGGPGQPRGGARQRHWASGSIRPPSLITV